MIVPSRRTHGTRSSRWFQTSESRPPVLRTRAISGSARSWSNQWKAWAETTTSYERSPAGISSADACEVRTSGSRSWSLASIAASGSVACTSCPRATSCSVSLPVPAPSSSTDSGWSEVSQAAASRGYDGRPRS